jgi:hypothetical protein
LNIKGLKEKELLSNLNKALDDYILAPNFEELMQVDNPALFSNGLPK